MSELDIQARIAALRSTFATIEAVLDPESLKIEIASLSEQASVPNLWDDTEVAQKITSALSHRQTELARIAEITQRLTDIDVLIDMADEAGDSDSAN